MDWGATDSVARWDGADAEAAARADALVKAQRPAFRHARDRDSYDEDYDRGRTKKVRLRGPLAFGDDDGEGGGHNPFTSRAQQMAHGRPKDGAKRGAGRMRRDADAEAKGVKPGRGGGRSGGRGRGGRGGGGRGRR